MNMQILKKLCTPKGRSPRGYGLPSLVVVLFFGSVVIQLLINAMARETTEAKAEAAFNMAREHISAFEITGDLAGESMPHVSGSRYLQTGLIPDAANPALTLTYRESDGRAAVLFDQKLRAFVNVPNEEGLASIPLMDLRRRHPERVLRAGDRMATNLETGNIVNANQIRTGVGTVLGTATANRFVGIDSTIIRSPVMTAETWRVSKLEVASDVQAQNVAVGLSLNAASISAEGATFSGLVRAVDGDFENTIVADQVISLDAFESYDEIDIGTLNVRGLRVGTLRAGVVRSDDARGAAPRRGQILPRDDIEAPVDEPIPEPEYPNTAQGRYDACRDNSGSRTACYRQATNRSPSFFWIISGSERVSSRFGGIF